MSDATFGVGLWGPKVRHRDPQVLSSSLLWLDIDRFATAIETYRPRLERQVEVLNGIIDKASIDGRAVHMNDLMYFYAFDSMGEFAFNKDFGMMRNEQWHDAANMIRRAISILGPMKSVIWLIRLGFYFLPWFWRIGDWFNALHFCQARLEHRIHVSSPTVPFSDLIS